MKRLGNLLPKVARQDNLREAYLRAVRGKRTRPDVREFASCLNENLDDIGRQLLNGTYRFGEYRTFVVHDPKRREIFAASFRDRITFHAMMRICHETFDDYQVYDSFASREGKGTYAALDRALQFCRKYRWFAKLDVVKYFDSIDHGVLKQQLRRLFKDKQLLAYFDQLIDGYVSEQGAGVPIGNLTSQYFANHYLSPADHYAKESLGVTGLVRYMDDVLLFGNDKAALLEQVRDYQRWVEENLHLQHHELLINPTVMGIPFLGYVVHPYGLRLNNRSSQRFLNKMKSLTAAFNKGEIDIEEFSMRCQCLHAFINKADCTRFKLRARQSPGVYPQGL